MFMLAMAKVGAMLGGIAGKTLPVEAAKKVGLVALVVVAVLLLILGKVLYDRSVIAGFTADQRADTAEAVTEADRDADIVAATEAEEFNASQTRIEAAGAEAVRADPEAAKRPVGPATRSYYDNLPEERQ